MNKEFHIIVVDNDTEDIIGNVTTFQIDGFSAKYRQQENDITRSFDTIDALLNWFRRENVTIYYMIGGVRIPMTDTTYNKSHYLDKVGWNNLTPAEALILGVLMEEKSFHNEWVSTKHLQETLKVFGFTPTSLRMLLVKLRKKLANTSLRVKNQNRMGYRLIGTESDPTNEFLMKEIDPASDYWILYNDEKLKHIVTDDIQHLISSPYSIGTDILTGWNGLTRTEAEIFFELVKHRGDWVRYKYLLKLPWSIRYNNDKKVIAYSLRNFISKIRKKIADSDQEILTRYGIGYCLI